MAQLDAKAEFYRKRALVAEATPTLAGGGAYSSGDIVGSKMTFSTVVQFAGLGGYIHSLTILDKGAESQPMDLILFNEDPSASTFTDNAASAIHASDMAKVIGTIPVTAEDYVIVNSSLHIATVRGVGLAFDCAATLQTIYGVLRTTGTPTYAAGDIVVKLGIVQG